MILKRWVGVHVDMGKLIVTGGVLWVVRYTVEGKMGRKNLRMNSNETDFLFCGSQETTKKKTPSKRTLYTIKSLK